MTNIFDNKKPDIDRLLKYGFVENGGCFEFSKNILNNEFRVTVKIFNDGKIKTETTEYISGEIYTLHLMEYAKGTFIGQVREEYENILENIAENCFILDIFKSKITKQIIKYITEKYKDEPEYLWEKFPDNAIFRRKDNKKWYAAILTTQRNRLGFDSKESVEIIDLRASKEDVPNLVRQENIYPGWHMNKKSWITIILDGSMDTKEICNFVDKSYILAKK